MEVVLNVLEDGYWNGFWNMVGEALVLHVVGQCYCREERNRSKDVECKGL